MLIKHFDVGFTEAIKTNIGEVLRLNHGQRRGFGLHFDVAIAHRAKRLVHAHLELHGGLFPSSWSA